ncbi:hypothetical protein BB560_003938 [Smittium megazygosporum]|uniref:Sld7 C-terminal domain-containing protein n=1 Tax=Smittium megazygosporum TaxID=133381 RepID=A0A2T9ZAL3_9FUNG|nr:hypothetical protein BB560_003938 [Smittium megazygosporum]
MEIFWSGLATFLDRKISADVVVSAISTCSDIFEPARIKRLEFLGLVDLESTSKYYVDNSLGSLEIFLGNLEYLETATVAETFYSFLEQMIDDKSYSTGWYSAFVLSPSPPDFLTHYPIIIYPFEAQGSKVSLRAVFLDSFQASSLNLKIFQNSNVELRVPCDSDIQKMYEEQIQIIDDLDKYKDIHFNKKLKTTKDNMQKRSPIVTQQKAPRKELSQKEIEEKNKKILKQLIIIELKMKKILRNNPEFDELWCQIYKSSRFALRKKLSTTVLSLGDLQMIVAKNTDLYCS